MSETKKLSAVEALKASSHRLRGTLAEELAAGGIQVSEDAYQLLKFHGSYEQFDRDTATDRKQHGIEKEYQFMLRVRMPGGRLTAAQYLALDALADDRANGTIRITTRQGIQFHGILKGNLKPAIAAINDTLLTTMSACGDVVRNIMSSPTPARDAKQAHIWADAQALSEHLKPKSRAYFEIFLGEAPAASGGEEEEPLYGPTYLPRKFKIGITHAADNTIDVLTNDLGIVAIFDGDILRGYNIAVGGGLGMTHNNARTYPRLATPIAFVQPDQFFAIVDAVIKLQRDHGDRTNRRRARLKYVIDDMGLPWMQETLAGYFGAKLTPPVPMQLAVPDLLGWHEQGDGRLWLGVPVAAGRIADQGDMRLRTALRTIAERFAPGLTLTPQQDALLTDIAPTDRDAIEGILRDHDVTLAEQMTPMAQYALSCPALPTCGLALTEAERMHGEIVGGLDALLAKHGLSNRRLSVRITGCPNGCARTYAGDVGIVGRMPGFYAVFVGGDFEGARLNFKLLEKVAHADVISLFDPLFAAWARDGAGEGFGDFCDRLGLDALLGLMPAARQAA